MSWRERDYWQGQWGERGSLRLRLHLPPRGTLLLIVLHAVAFVTVQVVRSAAPPPIKVFALAGASAHPLGILLHPYATESLWSIAITVFVAWVLAARIESRYGTGRMLTLYAAGNLLAGAVYFAVARGLASLAGIPLDYPAGAMAAWGIAAWRDLSDEAFVLFGRPLSAAKVTGVVAAIVAGVLLLVSGLGAVAWLLALAGGGASAWLIGAMPAIRLPQRRRVLRRVARSAGSDNAARRRPIRAEEPDLDAILAKISRCGLDSLTQEERDRLEAARRDMLRQSRR